MAASVQLPMQMDPLFLSLSLFRRRKLDECVEVCTELLKKNPYDQVILPFLRKTALFWEKMAALSWSYCKHFKHT